MHYLAIFIGGGLGSLCRFWLSQYNGIWSAYLPVGTMLANFLSCIVLGFITTFLATKTDMSTTIKPLIAIGFCGGFSTFSTFSLETFNLLANGQTYYALANVLISMLICLLALYLGSLLGK